MAIIIDEKKMIEENIFQYENKLKSPTSRFLDSTPTFVTYYHINIDETTTDEGFKDVASIIGFRSPLKFKKINNLPLYGIEQMVLQLEDQDQGLDTNFSSEATVLPNTIKPVPNDFFMIPYLHDVYLFRVTEITYDNVMPDNFYKINYQLEYIEEEKVDSLEKQVEEKYNCILENIGSENKCIIEEEYFDNIEKIKNMYEDIKKTYLYIFYNERHNCLLGELGRGERLYDPYQTEFINNHSLFNKKNDLSTLLLTEEFSDIRRKIKYEKSIYRFIERRDIRLINNFTFCYYKGTMEHESSFYRWSEKNIVILDTPKVLPEDKINILSDEFIEKIKNNEDTGSKYGNLIKDYLNKSSLDLKLIPLDLNEELLYLNDSLEVFFFTPIILYIIKYIIDESIKK